MNDTEKELQFLQIVRVNGNLYHLTLSGWSYKEVIEMLSSLSRRGVVDVRDGGTVLTKKGNEYFKKLYTSLEKKGVDRFLLPALEHKNVRLIKETIYIPTTIRANEEF